MSTPKPFSLSVINGVKTSYPRLQHLLVPLDFSGKYRQALRYAVPLAQKFSAKFHLVHVLAPGKKAEVARQPAREEKTLRRFNLTRPRLLPPTHQGGNLVLTGEPAPQILAVAAKFGADLIVLTTKGCSGLKRVLLGSTAEHVMRHSLCPVMSVRRH